MSGLTTAGAIAGATEQVAKDAAPAINQLVEQSYEDAYKQRTARSQVVLAALIAQPGDLDVVRDFESVLTGLCTDAGYIRAGGVQRCYSLSVSDLAIFADVLALCIKQAEQLAASPLAK
jgi:hypothetical protein